MADDAFRKKLQNISKRNWQDIRKAWIDAGIPSFQGIGVPPSPAVHEVPGFQQLQLTGDVTRLEDIQGLRGAALSEAIYLFHKCAHATFASQTLGYEGMHSWAMFSAYHAAFFGAKAVMALLGTAFPPLNGNERLVDFFPESGKSKRSGINVTGSFHEFVVVKIPKFEQRHLWQAFQRTVNVTTVDIWPHSLRDAVLEVKVDEFARPRNNYLYRNSHWPLNDLTDVLTPGSLSRWIDALDPDESGFLLRLNMVVYQMLDVIVEDLGKYSSGVREQYQSCLQQINRDVASLEPYRKSCALYA